MSRLAYHTAAARADRAMATVVTFPLCPDCGQPVRCVVDGTDVDHVPECADPEVCYGQSRIDRIERDARDRAQGERQSYLDHLRDGGE